MKQTTDLSWLSAPAFFLIVGILAIHSKKPIAQHRQTDKNKTENVIVQIQKPT